MARDPKQFEITKLLSITENDKYATAVAAFEVIDQLSVLELPKKWKNRKPAVQAMMAISEETVKFGYIEDSVRTALEEELDIAGGKSDASFRTSTGAAPAVEEEDEDLDEIGETAPVEAFAEDSDYEDDSDSDSDSDDDDDDSDEDDSDDSDDDDDDDE